MTEEARNNGNNPDFNENVYNESFKEVGSLSDLKSVPSATVITSSAYNSPIQTSNSEESEPEPESELQPRIKQHKWPKYKTFKDPNTGEEAIYELVSPKPTHSNTKGGLFTLCSELVTLSSISLFVASNLFAFTVGMLVGKRIAYDF